MNASLQGKRRLSPSAAIAIAVAAASAFTSCLALLSWSLASGSVAAVALPLLFTPALLAAAAWAVSRLVIRAELAPVAEGITRLAAQDFVTPNTSATDETRELTATLERCRMALADRQKPAKAHAAVARLMGAAIGRLAQGDLTARITVELPEPYRAFRDDFNTAMHRLQTSGDGLGTTVADLSTHARAIEEGATQLSRRATKLAERLENDIRLIDASADTSPEDAIRIARHMLEGVAVASRRNIEAARHFTTVGRQVGQEAERLATRTSDKPETPLALAESPSMPSASVPATLGATVLKLHG